MNSKHIQIIVASCIFSFVYQVHAKPIELKCDGVDSDNDKVQFYVKTGMEMEFVHLFDSDGASWLFFASQANNLDFVSSANIGDKEITFERRSRSPYKGRNDITNGSIDRLTGKFKYNNVDFDGVEYSMKGDCVPGEVKAVERRF